ncbi:beta strand repeat-containing protein [Hymenobacter baengnokdamensis]|uniref:beta strand repeat-containing protein n=1 Tax=Hymenobacter baengnokdamensis TaxID=2615203 RepID=UPI00124522C2|nr:hypothetical protein [Hymenobacter baengnokdamensis]
MKQVYSLVCNAALALLPPLTALAQTGSVGIGTTAPDASAALDIVSSKGVLLPRVADATALASPATGLIVYQTGGTTGFYYNAGTPATPSWQQLATAAGTAITATNGLTKTGSAIGLGGTLTQATTIANAGYTLALTGSGFIGIGTTTPNTQLANTSINTFGVDNNGGGNNSLNWAATQSGYVGMFYNGGTNQRANGVVVKINGTDPTATALDVSKGAQSSVGTSLLAVKASGNVGIGVAAPAYPLDVAGVANASTGLRVGGNAVAYYYGNNLYLGTSNLPATAPSGTQNTLAGTNAGLSLTSGINNAVLGYLAGDALTSGSSNALLGVQAGGSLTTGTDNVFVGHDPGYSNVSGSRNIGIGYNALANSTADDNVAVGNTAGVSITTGAFNTLLGSGANLSSTQRNRATALGYNARVDQDDAVVLGDPANVAVRTGLGTATPAAKLDIQGGADSNGTNDPSALAFSWHDGGFRHFVRSRHNGTLGSGGNDLDFFLNNSATGAGSTAAGTGNVQVLTLENNNGLPRVGIGTTAPTQALDVTGSATVSGNGYVGGNLGIGMTPANKLDVSGTIRSQMVNGSFFTTDYGPGGGFSTVLLGYFQANGVNYPQLRFQNATASPFFDIGQNTNGDFVVEGNDTNRFTVQRSTGYVGMNTLTPNSTLQVNGSVAASIRTLGSGTIADTDYTVLVTGAVALPTPSATNTGRLYHLLNGNANSNTITGTLRDAGTTGTFTSFTLGTSSGGKGITVQSDGTQWWIVTRE